ncbi:HAMP domain-containing histidine kinase [Microbacteriaceae bacterium VKM Ac-2854]|nr:HAMP domain-containing histidine kinase [Microbacteriaceae bacterium VKM Ac-2854]
MTGRAARRHPDADDLALRRASRRVGWHFVVAASGVAVLALVGAFAYVLHHVPAEKLFQLPLTDNHRMDVGARDFLLALIAGGALAIVFSGLAAWILTRRAVQPLGEALRRQREFVADASHELRTPLTILDARLQILQRSLLVDDPHRSAVAELRRDTRTLIDIVNDLLAAADLSDSDETAPLTDVTAVVNDAIAATEPLARRRDILIDAAARAPVIAAIPPTRLRRCVTALLDNALRHSPEGSRITVTQHATSAAVTITVTDRGHGIRGIDPERIFDRFAHSEAAVKAAVIADGTSTAGHGIGLALVRDTLLRYGGDVSVAATGPDGTSTALTLPIAQSPPVHSDS